MPRPIKRPFENKLFWQAKQVKSLNKTSYFQKRNNLFPKAKQLVSRWSAIPIDASSTEVGIPVLLKFIFSTTEIKKQYYRL